MTVVGRPASPAGVHTLTPGTCENVTWHSGLRRLIKAAGLKLEILLDYLMGLSHRSLQKQRSFSSCGQGCGRRGSKYGEDSVLRGLGAPRTRCSERQGHVQGPERPPGGQGAPHSHKEMGPPFYKELDSADTRTSSEADSSRASDESPAATP